MRVARRSPPEVSFSKLSLSILAQGVTTVTIPTGIFNDLAGNPGPPAAQAYSFTYDITAPVLNPITDVSKIYVPLDRFS